MINFHLQSFSGPLVVPIAVRLMQSHPSRLVLLRLNPQQEICTNHLELFSPTWLHASLNCKVVHVTCVGTRSGTHFGCAIFTPVFCSGAFGPQGAAFWNGGEAAPAWARQGLSAVDVRRLFNAEGLTPLALAAAMGQDRMFRPAGRGLLLPPVSSHPERHFFPPALRARKPFPAFPNFAPYLIFIL